MEGWKQEIFSLIACALGCGIISQMIADTKRKALVRVLSGIVLAICILQPLSDINPEDVFTVPEWNPVSADRYILEGEKTASETQAGYIKASCEAYILDRAKTLGTEITAEVSLNQNLIPDFVEIRGESSPDAQMQLQDILTTDLGIPKENQKWIWNLESNSS